MFVLLDITLQSRGAKRRECPVTLFGLDIGPVTCRGVTVFIQSIFRPRKTLISRTNTGICGLTRLKHCFLTPEIPLLVRLIEVFGVNYRVHLLRTTNKHTNTQETNAIDFSNVRTEVALRAIIIAPLALFFQIMSCSGDSKKACPEPKFSIFVQKIFFWNRDNFFTPHHFFTIFFLVILHDPKSPKTG